MKQWVADCCSTPAVLRSETTDTPSELTAKCASCGCTWTLHGCALHEDGFLVAAKVSRPKRTSEILKRPSAGRVIQLSKGKNGT